MTFAEYHHHDEGTDPMTYTVYANVDRRDTCYTSNHRTLKGAGRSYQAAHTGNLRRVLDSNGRDVTHAACDAASAGRGTKGPIR